MSSVLLTMLRFLLNFLAAFITVKEYPVPEEISPGIKYTNYLEKKLNLSSFPRVTGRCLFMMCQRVTGAWSPEC